MPMPMLRPMLMIMTVLMLMLMLVFFVAWIRNGCKARWLAEQDSRSVAACALRLELRPDAQAATQTKHFALLSAAVEAQKVAANQFFNQNKTRNITQAAFNAARDMQLTEDTLKWSASSFAAGALARAEVLAVDDQLVLALNGTTKDEKDKLNWCLLQKLEAIKQKLDKFAAWKGTVAGKKSTKNRPDEKVELKSWTRMHDELAKLEASLEAYNFGLKYECVAFKYQCLGLLNFCRWCAKQQKQQARFLADRRKIFAECCKGWGRHPDTPGVAKSWPPVVVDADLDAYA